MERRDDLGATYWIRKESGDIAPLKFANYKELLNGECMNFTLVYIKISYNIERYLIIPEIEKIAGWEN